MKKEYIKPAVEIIEIEVSEAIMNMSFGDGNTSDLGEGTENYARRRGIWDEW